MNGQYLQHMLDPIQAKHCSLGYISEALMAVIKEPRVAKVLIQILLCNEERLFQILKATDSSYLARHTIEKGLATTRQLLTGFSLSDIPVSSKKYHTFCFLNFIPNDYLILDSYISVGSRIIQDDDISHYQVKHVNEHEDLAFYSAEQKARLQF